MQLFLQIYVYLKRVSAALVVGSLRDHRLAHHIHGTRRTPRLEQNIACPAEFQSRPYGLSLGSCCRSSGKQLA